MISRAQRLVCPAKEARFSHQPRDKAGAREWRLWSHVISSMISSSAVCQLNIHAFQFRCVSVFVCFISQDSSKQYHSSLRLSLHSPPLWPERDPPPDSRSPRFLARVAARRTRANAMRPFVFKALATRATWPERVGAQRKRNYISILARCRPIKAHETR